MTSSAHPIDIGIFIVFLLINLVVGLRYGRSVKTLKEYALGNKDFSTAALVSTIVATWITGRYLIARTSHIYQDGLYVIILYLCEVGSLVLIGWVFTMRMGPFLQSTSIAEAMGRIYGKTIRSITAFFGLTASVGLVALQFIAGAKIFGMLFGWDSIHATVIVGVILIIYSALGGVRAVTFTDMLQFFTFGTLIPIFALMIWNNTRDFSAVYNMVRETPHMNIKTFLTSPESAPRWGLLTFLPMYIIPAFAPAIFQRVSIAKDVYQARRSFLYSSLIYLFITLLVIWIALLIRTQNDQLDFGSVFPYIVENYAPTGFKGLLLVGFVAMMMSTADSNLNAAATILANDVIVPLLPVRSKSWFKVLSSDKGQLMIAKVSSVVLGLLALRFSLDPNSYLHPKFTSSFWNMPWLMPWLRPWNFYMPVISVPLLLTILGFRSTTRTVLIGMAAGFLTVYLWVHLLPHASVDSSVPGMLANLIGFVGSHYLLNEPGGWQPLDSASPVVLERTLRRQAWKQRWKAARAFKLYPYLQQNLPFQDQSYVFLGLYAILAVYASLYTIETVSDTAYGVLYEGIYYTVLPITTTFLTFPFWSSVVKNNRFMVYFWPVGIGTILFFAGMLLATISHFQPIQVMILMLNILVGVLLLRWPLALFLAFTGIILAIFTFQQYTGAALPTGAPNLLQFRLMYGLLLFSSFLVAFFKGKRAYRRLSTSHAQLKTEYDFTSQMWLSTLRSWAKLHHDASSYSPQILHQTRQLEEQLHAYSHSPTKAQLIAENTTLQKYTYQLDVINKHLNQVLHQAQQPMTLAVEKQALTVLYKNVLTIMGQHKQANNLTIQYRTACPTLCADPKKIQRLLVGGLTYVIASQHAKQPILLGFEDTQLAYPVIAIPGYIKYVKALCITMTTEKVLPIIQKHYLGSIDQEEPQWLHDIAALPLSYNQQIVGAHYGFSETIHHTDGVTLRYIIPWAVREVRPPVMDHWQRTTTVSNLEPATHPLENVFVQAARAKTSIDNPLLQQVLRFIKHYHGSHVSHTGEPYYLRALAVAQIVLDYTQDVDTLLAALLHDIVEQTHCSSHQISLQFNPAVQRIVEGVTGVDSRLKSYKKLQLSPDESIRKLLENKDERVFYVKLADRLHNMRTMAGHLAPEKQKAIAKETLLVFVTLAEKLRLTETVEELKERCSSVLSGNI